MTDAWRLAVVAAVFCCALAGWWLSGYAAAAAGLVVGLGLLVVRWRRLTLWSWAALYLRRDRRITLTEPMTVANDRAGGGVRYQDGVAVALIQLLGRRYQPTLFTGSTTARSSDAFDVGELIPAMRQSLGLTVESISVISIGARRRASGDYARVYDTLIGTPPYAGQRETWLVVRIRAQENGVALGRRSTIGTATLASAQRLVMMLRCTGVRARVGTAVDVLELERRIGVGVLEPHNRRWDSVRSDGGWHTTYGYRPSEVTAAALAHAWSLPADGIVQNLTVFPDATCSATVTVRTPKPPASPPSLMLQPLPGEQAQAIAAGLCCPRPEVRRLGRGRLQPQLSWPIGPSGVLMGKTSGGDRLALPLGDPVEQSRVHIAAVDAIAKRIIVRAAATGERVTVHSTDIDRWNSVRMPHVAVTEHPRPALGTTVSVIDGTVAPTPRPATVIQVSAPRGEVFAASDVVITQTGPSTIDVIVGAWRQEIEMEFFRAENRYAAKESTSNPLLLEPVE